MSEIKLPGYIETMLDRIIDENGFSDYTMEIKRGSETGDGFLSELSSITILENGNTDKRLDLVCKIAPLNKNRRKEFFANIVFDRETTFYTKVAPTFAKFQDDKRIPTEDRFSSYPKCFAAISDDENEQYVIIMEDLRPQGFQMWNKAKPARIENLRLAMQELGKFHGLSIAMKDQRPDEFAEFQEIRDISQMFFQSQNMQTMFDASFDRAIGALRKEDHKDIMRTLKNHTLDHFEACINDETTNRFGVISHGNSGFIFSLSFNMINKSVHFMFYRGFLE